jgi:hypothetical protein
VSREINTWRAAGSRVMPMPIGCFPCGLHMLPSLRGIRRDLR